jgi:hypothetical protein
MRLKFGHLLRQLDSQKEHENHSGKLLSGQV